MSRLKSLFALISRCYVCKDRSVDDRVVAQELPDDIIIDILSRLPAEFVLKYRCVCKRWLSLTSSSYFSELHLKRAKPVILIREVSMRSVPNLFIVDHRGGGGDKVVVERLRGDELVGLMVVGACDGLIVLQPTNLGPVYRVYNIITREQVNVTAPVPEDEQPLYTWFHAIFRHSRTKSYMMLFSCPHGDRYHLDFWLYNFTTKLWKKVSTYPHKPDYKLNPVIFNGNLHWAASRMHDDDLEEAISPCEASITVFDTDNESLRVRPHPGGRCFTLHKGMFIFETKGSLFFCSILSELVSVWVLEDYNDWSWRKWKSVNLSVAIGPPRRVPFQQEYQVKLVSVENYELVLRLPQGLYRLYLCGSTDCKVILDNKKMKKCGLAPDAKFFYMFSLTKSFVSFNGC